METRVGVAVLGVLAGALLCVGGAMAFLDDREQDWHRLASIGGYAVGVGALVLAGYGLVDHAPGWLRLIVSVGLPMLAITVWQVVAEEVDAQVDGWRSAPLTHLVAGTLLLVVGLVGARAAARDSRRYRPSHR